MAHTVLVVDDSPTHRSIIRVFLMGRSFVFLDAESGEQGLAIVHESPVDLVIADVNMPGMDGIEFVRTLRADKDKKIRRVPVIVLTAEKGDELVTRAIEAGADEFVRKPISSGALCDAVDRLLAPRPAA